MILKESLVIRFIRCAAIALMLVPMMGAAQGLRDGAAAYSSGDYAKALRDWTPLAEDGDVAAQRFLGHMYRKGIGVLQDDAEAAKWYRRAAEQGDADSQASLGIMYAFGFGVPQDDAEAAKWYRRGAEQGDAASQYLLGLTYGIGTGVPKDFIAAHMWLNLSAAQGNENAASKRDLAAAKMPPADISEAQRRAKVCLASNYKDCD